MLSPCRLYAIDKANTGKHDKMSGRADYSAPEPIINHHELFDTCAAPPYRSWGAVVELEQTSRGG